MDLAENLSSFRTNSSLQVPFNLTFDDYIFDNSAVRFSLYVVYTIVFCLCFFGNLAVVIVVTCHWRMRSVTKFCMGNLAFANLCVAVFCVYQNMSTFLQEDWIFGRFLCKMYHFTNSLSHSASILILVVICGERYLSIVHPLRCRRTLTIQRQRVIIIGVWILSGLISSPRLFYITTFEVPIPIGPDGEHDEICAPMRTLYDSYAADMTYFVVLFLLPLLVMCVLYTKIARIIWQSSAMLQQPPVITVTDTSRSNQDGQTELSPLQVELASPAPRNYLVSEEPCRPPGNMNATAGNIHSKILKRTNSSGDEDQLTNNGNKVETIVSICGQQCQPMTIRSDLEYGNPANGCEGCERGKVKPPMVGPGAVSRVMDDRKVQVLQSRQAAIRMLIIIVLTFALCNFPYHLRKICQYYMANYNLWSSFNQFLTPFTFLLMYINCAVNPVIYFFRSKDFRSSLIDLLRLRLARPRP